MCYVPLARRRPMRRRSRLTAALVAISALLAAGAARAQVPVCEALTMYGNAVNTGVCQSLSPATQTHWVCGLAGPDPDIHTTFNATTPLHITVRVPQPACEGNSTLGGNWPGHLVIAQGQPRTICNNGLQAWVTQLNGVPGVARIGQQSFCVSAFLTAIDNGTISYADAQTYIDQCRRRACP